MPSRRDLLKAMVGTTAAAGFLPLCGSENNNRHTASYWDSESDGRVRCRLCPRGCILTVGATGFCRVRRNDGGTLYTLGYGNPCAVHDDPIEKKPLFHVTPGKRAYSIAVAGCNLRCLNCQNYTISQESPLNTVNEVLPPARVIEEARRAGCSSVAYTYSEPTVWFEYMYDTARLARSAGLKNLWITSGYINPGPLKDLAKYMDAVNIDLKSFSDDVYKKLNNGRLQPILDAVILAKQAGIWVELGNLVVPEWSDNLSGIEALCRWISTNLGNDVPLHFLRFHPMYKLSHLYPTPTQTLVSARDIAIKVGIQHVYVGNVAGFDLNTYCPECRRVVIKRDGFISNAADLKSGACRHCGRKIAGLWI
jgi:pyruvate formate lyase activating enzyme